MEEIFLTKESLCSILDRSRQIEAAVGRVIFGDRGFFEKIKQKM